MYVVNPNLDNGLHGFLNDCFTYDLGDWCVFKRTYVDIDCTETDCEPARRSFGDIVSVCRTYFPKATEQEIAKALLNIDNIISFICCDIDKWVFCIDEEERATNGGISHVVDIDTVPDCDTYSLLDIIELSKL